MTQMGYVTYATIGFIIKWILFYDKAILQTLPYKNNSPFRSGIFARESYVNTTPTNENCGSASHMTRSAS